MFRSLLTAIVLGRKNGLRRTFISRFFGAEDTSPNSAYSAPKEDYAGVAYGGTTKMEPPKDVTPPDGFEVVLHRNALKNGEVTEVIIAGKAIAVAMVNDEIFAMENSCPHAGGPLAEGTISGTVLSCPYHGWGFDVESGKCQTNPEFQIETFATHVVGEAICVHL